MISISMQVTIIFLLLFALLVLFFCKAIKNDAKALVLIALALGALLCLGIAEYGIYIHVTSKAV